jgi:hypothetical protein
VAAFATMHSPDLLYLIRDAWPWVKAREVSRASHTRAAQGADCRVLGSRRENAGKRLKLCSRCNQRLARHRVKDDRLDAAARHVRDSRAYFVAHITLIARQSRSALLVIEQTLPPLNSLTLKRP